MATMTCVNISVGDSMLSDGPKLLPKPMLTNYQKVFYSIHPGPISQAVMDIRPCKLLPYLPNTMVPTIATIL